MAGWKGDNVEGWKSDRLRVKLRVRARTRVSIEGCASKEGCMGKGAPYMMRVSRPTRSVARNGMRRSVAPRRRHTIRMSVTTWRRHAVESRTSGRLRTRGAAQSDVSTLFLSIASNRRAGDGQGECG